MPEHLKIFRESDRQTLTSTRKGETKLGERVELVSSIDDLENSRTRFVLLGIQEDIGIRANLGIGGAAHCWDIALRSLLNVQSNRFLDGSEIAVLGSLEFKSELAEATGLHSAKEDDLLRLRELTAKIDKVVSETVFKIVKAGKTPIMVGGGHNNAYGNISGSSKALGHAIPVINTDPHTDYRAPEGRHSGNGFRYARQEGFLGKYAVFGLHEGYNSETILKEFTEDDGLHFDTFESLLLCNEAEKSQRFLDTLNWLGSSSFGLELDLDSLTGFPVSAANPSGFSLNEVRQFIRAAASLHTPVYFHLCEGSPERTGTKLEQDLLAKSIAYLITDFIKTS